MFYSHSFEHPETGELIDVMVDDPAEYRNAPPRGRGIGRFFLNRPGYHDHRPQPDGFGTHRPVGGIRPRTHEARPVIVRDPGHDPGHGQPHPMPGTAGDLSINRGEYLAIKKSALAELAPVLGTLWASLLARPDAPQAIGNDIVDRDNAAMHREALAIHQQNQTRILALTDLVARAARLFL